MAAGAMELGANAAALAGDDDASGDLGHLGLELAGRLVLPAHLAGPVALTVDYQRKRGRCRQVACRHLAPVLADGPVLAGDRNVDVDARVADHR